MTWKNYDTGYELFFNRDELRTRLIAFPPKVHTSNGVSFIAPIDADAGGTWMGVNEFGVSVCLLNGFGRVDQKRTDYVSRGTLVMSLLDVSNGEAARDRIGKIELAAFRPFSLVVMEPNHPVFSWIWDGVRAKWDKSVVCPLISSSFRLTEVAKHRQTLFHRWDVQKTKALEDFHRSHRPEAGPFSVCMHRDEAQTVSLSQVVVTKERVAFYYSSGHPCKTDLDTPIAIPRIANSRSADF
jgi:hypothetical protein